MSEILNQVRRLVAGGQFDLTGHGHAELNNDGLLVADVVAGVQSALVVEAYPDYHKGPSVLVLQQDGEGKPVHVLWGIAKGTNSPAFIVTAYRLNPDRWSASLLERRAK